MKLGRKLVSLLLALVMVFSLTATASAADKVTVKLSPNITVTLDGEAQAMADVKGNPVYPVLYGGTTYLPVRAVGNMLGLDVDWDQATQTVLLTTSDGKTSGGTTGSKAPATAKPTDITVSINPGITVKLDGEVQKMTNVNGDPVYPMLYGGTTYLPVRAVSNMLDVDVDWDGTTQTVILESKPIVYTINFVDGTVLKYGPDDRDACRKDLEELGWFDEDDIQGYLERFDTALEEWEYKQAHPPLGGNQTSEDAKVLGDKHIGYNWAEIDWSTASDGYVRVKINNKIAAYATCSVECYNKAEDQHCYSNVTTNIAQIDTWQNLPLRNTSSSEYECLVTVKLNGFADEYNGNTNISKTLQARFTAKINAPESNNVWLMSHMRADYENAPNVCAKALEITKNCKTDAEKIEAVFKFVANNISYDNNQYLQGGTATVSMWQRDMNPDNILKAGKGVCEHYAILMTAMLRSLAIQCKLVDGWLKSDGKWVGHAWVAVKPATGTLNISGMGKDYENKFYDDDGNVLYTDPTGWIRLDPTNAHVPGTTSNDSNYKTNSYY